ncbi:hypothetical protein [Gloeothece verrucosa]|uniref:Uncharacterized protein n=1 Tax=Gloeothece verrucosa (strain PCC 7822) TaxID=497965 RepID=E0U7B6_GLOV7|nr:hypothetical protein [Gloeothece verrucosa]ADN12503.1 hypothetical protein Cyan7822_0458 [Gloeothece verrucosa PCC 7822]
MSTSEQFNFVFRHQPKRTSKYGILLTYINQDGADLTRCERMLHPVAAFWLPFAYQNCTDASSSELQQLARSAVYQLKLHIHYLENSFGLNDDSSALEPTQKLEKPFLAEVSTNGWHEKDNLPKIEDFSDEDDILSQLI